MTDETEAELKAIDPVVLQGMAAAVGVSLTSARAAMLAPQAEQHFAQLRDLDSIADPSSEPAAELRLDCWTRLGGG
jgi:aryl-alcohol dehydrogenase-like predicted oxidoreductase